MPTTAAVRRSVLLVLLVLLTSLGLAPAAQAHDVLVGSEPTEGATLDTAPESIVLSFNNAPLDVGSVITVVDAAGTVVAEGEGSVEGTDVVLPLDTTLPGGELEVRWRVASSDGHPIEGVIPFTVAEQTAPTAPAEPTAAPAAEPTAEPATEPAGGEPEDSGLAGLPTGVKVAIAVAAVGALAAVLIVMLRRQRGDRL